MTNNLQARTFPRISSNENELFGFLRENPSGDLGEQLLLIEQKENFIREQLRLAVQETLNEHAGKIFSSLEETKAMASRIQAVLSRNQLMIKCPYESEKIGGRCGRPGRLRGNDSVKFKETGTFAIEHPAPNRTLHTIGNALPHFELVFDPKLSEK